MKHRIILFIFLFFTFSMHPASAQNPPHKEFGMHVMPPLHDYNFFQLLFKWDSLFTASLKESVTDFKMNRAPVSKNWSEIEPKENSYKLDDLYATFEKIKAHKQPLFFGLHFINTNQKEVPADLVNTRWNDPKMKERMIGILDKIFPQFAKNEITFFAFGNEVDVYFDQHKNEIKDFLELRATVDQYLRKKYPHVILGVTTTFDGLENNRTSIVTEIQKDNKFIFMTYYPMNNLQVKSPQSPFEDFTKIIAFAKGRKILLQEAGYPSSPINGSSEKAQAEFIVALFKAWEQNASQIIFISYFLQSDFSDSICNDFVKYYNLPIEGKDNPFKSFLCSLGLQDAYGRHKLGWDTLKKIRQRP